MKYEENEQEEMRRNSSVSPQLARRQPSIWQDSLLPRERPGEDKAGVDKELEKGDVEYRHSVQA